MSTKRYARLGFALAGIIFVCFASAQWPARWNNSSTYDDEAAAVAVDHQGNVFVVGKTKGPRHSYWDMQVLKYSAAGYLLWHKEYHSQDHDNGNAAYSGDTFGTGIVVDWEGNCYASGVAYSGSTRKNDFVVWKLDRNGDIVWPTSGSHGSGLAAYDFDNGAIRLSSSSDDGVNVHDSAKRVCAIAIIDEPGSQSNFAITGPTDGGNGNSKWRTALFQDDGYGDVEIAPGWPVDQFGDIEDEDDQPNAVAIYSDSSVYVTGGVHSSNATENFTTIRYYSAGGGADPFYYWIKTLAPLSGKPGEGTAIALDKDGNAYATGYLHDSAGNDYATLKILKDPDGFDPVTPWTNEYSAYDGGIGRDEAYSISLSYEVVDDELVPYVYVTGLSQAYLASLDIATLRLLGSDGSKVWSGDGAKRYTGSGYDDAGMQVVASGNGNAYVIGLTGNGTNDDYVLLGYDKTGSNLFSAVTYNNGGLDRGYALAIGSAGSVFYTGTSADSGQLDFYTDIKSGFGTIDTKVPWSLSYTGGAQPSGSVSDVQSSNDAYYSLHGLVSGNNYLDMVFIFETTINSQSPQEITVTVESHVDKDDHGQKVEAYDYLNSSWVLVADQPATNGTDSSIVVTLPGDPARYIGDSDAAKIRVTTYVYPGYSHGSHYVFFDYVKWDVLH